MAGLLKTTAISLAAALSTAASAQILEPWDANERPQANTSAAQTYAVPDSRYKAPALNPDQRCRELATSSSIKVFPKAKEAFLQQGSELGCRYAYAMDKGAPIFQESYVLRNTKEASSFIKDFNKAEKDDTRPTARERQPREHTTRERPARRQRGEHTETTRETRSIPTPKPVTERRHSAEIVTPGSP